MNRRNCLKGLLGVIGIFFSGKQNALAYNLKESYDPDLPRPLDEYLVEYEKDISYFWKGNMPWHPAFYLPPKSVLIDGATGNKLPLNAVYWKWNVPKLLYGQVYEVSNKKHKIITRKEFNNRSNRHGSWTYWEYE